MAKAQGKLIVLCCIGNTFQLLNFLFNSKSKQSNFTIIVYYTVHHKKKGAYPMRHINCVKVKAILLLWAMDVNEAK